MQYKVICPTCALPLGVVTLRGEPAEATLQGHIVTYTSRIFAPNTLLARSLEAAGAEMLETRIGGMVWVRCPQKNQREG